MSNIVIFADLHAHNYREFAVNTNNINSRFQNCLDVLDVLSARVSDALESRDSKESLSSKNIIIENQESLKNQEILDTKNLLEDSSCATKIDKILFLGDLFQLKNNVDSQVIKLTMRKLLLLASKVEKMIIVPGNHDYRLWTSDPILLELVQEFSGNKILLIDKPTILRDEKLYIEPYSRRISELNERIKQVAVDNDTIFLGHQDINGIAYGGMTVVNGLDPEFLTKKFKFSFIGHYHNSAVIKENVISIGAPLQNSFSDMNTKKGWWEFDGKNVTFIENTFSPVFKEISTKSDEEITTIDNKNFYRIKILGTTLPRGIERLTYRRPMFIRSESSRSRSTIQFSDSIDVILKKYITETKTNLEPKKLLDLGIKYFQFRFRDKIFSIKK